MRLAKRAQRRVQASSAGSAVAGVCVAPLSVAKIRRHGDEARPDGRGQGRSAIVRHLILRGSTGHDRHDHESKSRNKQAPPCQGASARETRVERTIWENHDV